MIVFKIVALLILAVGFGTVFAAKSIVLKYKLDEKTKCDFEHEMNEEELKQYKLNRATVNLKLYGMIAAIPGLILTLVAFK